MEPVQSKGAMAEWDFRFVNSFNMFYLLGIFSIVGPVVGARGISGNRAYGLVGRQTNKQVIVIQYE